MIGKIIGAAVCLTFFMTPAGAQELGIGLSGGLQGMNYPLANGQSKPVPGGSLGVSYTFLLSGRWGILTGIGAGLYRTQATLRDGRFTYDEVDQAGSAFEYNVKTTGYKEIQHFFAAGIPLLLQYHTVGAGPQWYIDGGAKVFLPFGTGAAVSAQQMSLSAYYPDLNLEVSNLPQHGFGSVNNWKGDAGFTLKPAVALSGASGVSFGIAPGRRLYTGVYVDIGLTDIKGKNDSMPLVTYSSTGVGGARANGVMNMTNAGAAKLFAVGLQVRLTLGPSKAKPVRRYKTPPPHQDSVSKPAPSALSEDELQLIQTPVVFGVVGGTLIPELQREHLDQVIEVMKQHPELRISIVGHICNGGAESEDKKVGLARAVAIQRYLQSNGINRKSRRIDVGVAAESDTEDPNDPAANYWKRRAEITVVGR